MDFDTTFTQSPEWKRLLAEPNRERRKLLQLSSLSKLTSLDLHALIETVEQGADEERYTALTFFYQLASSSDPRMNASIRERLAPRLHQFVVMKYPDHEAARLSFAVLRNVDKASAYAYLNTLPLDRIPPTHIDRFLIDLSLGTSKSVVRLREIQRSHPDWTERIEKQLERAGQMGARKISTMAEDWRNSRTAKSLHKLHTAYLSTAHQLPVRTVLELLGEPDETAGNVYTFYAQDDGRRSARLQIESDGEGRYIADHLQNCI